MIIYNFRYRGPYEYDKYVNNILQFYNEVRFAEKKLTESDNDQHTIKEQVEDLNDIIESLTGENCYLQQLFMISEQIGG